MSLNLNLTSEFSYLWHHIVSFLLHEVGLLGVFKDAVSHLAKYTDHMTWNIFF